METALQEPVTAEELDALYWELIHDSVQDGWDYLDRHGPRRWYRHVNPERLDVAHPTRCVLGQLYGSYCEGAAKLHLSTAQTWWMAMYVPVWVQLLEGLGGTGRDIYADLTDEWRKRLILAA